MNNLLTLQRYVRSLGFVTYSVILRLHCLTKLYITEFYITERNMLKTLPIKVSRVPISKSLYC